MSINSTFQCFQAVKVSDEANEHNGRAGSVRSDLYTTGEGKAAREVVDVMLDADDNSYEEMITIEPAKLQAL